MMKPFKIAFTSDLQSVGMDMWDFSMDELMSGCSGPIGQEVPLDIRGGVQFWTD